MGTISDKLSYLEETKQFLREKLEELGATVTDEDTFRSYVEKMADVAPDTDYIKRAVEYEVSGVDNRKYEDTIFGRIKFSSTSVVCPKIIYQNDSKYRSILIPFSSRGNHANHSTVINGTYITYHRVIAPENMGLKIALNMVKPALLILPTSAYLVQYTLYNGSSGTDMNSFTTGLGFGQSVFDCKSSWINRTLSTTKRVVKFPKGFRLNEGKTLYLSKIYITQECLQEMVENLYDYIGTGEATEATRTISIGTINKSLLTDDEIKRALDKGWKIIT